jgi:biotin carboxyl carrier protein
MKYTLKVDGQTFEVEIDDIDRRPVIARVDGQEFEVSPETGAAATPGAAPAAALPTRSNQSGKVLTAPLPGVVLEVFVKPGEKVEAGQVLLVIEAMKMKNSIRSVRDGTIAAVHVTAGQTVAHKQALLEFVE